MLLRKAGTDLATIALWLGHEHLETVQIYLAADLELKQRALASVATASTRSTRYRPPPDRLLAFLEAL